MSRHTLSIAAAPNMELATTPANKNQNSHRLPCPQPTRPKTPRKHVGRFARSGSLGVLTFVLWRRYERLQLHPRQKTPTCAHDRRSYSKTRRSIPSSRSSCSVQGNWQKCSETDSSRRGSLRADRVPRRKLLARQAAAASWDHKTGVVPIAHRRLLLCSVPASPRQHRSRKAQEICVSWPSERLRPTQKLTRAGPTGHSMRQDRNPGVE